MGLPRGLPTIIFAGKLMGLPTIIFAGKIENNNKWSKRVKNIDGWGRGIKWILLSGTSDVSLLILQFFIGWMRGGGIVTAFFSDLPGCLLHWKSVGSSERHLMNWFGIHRGRTRTCFDENHNEILECCLKKLLCISGLHVSTIKSRELLCYTYSINRSSEKFKTGAGLNLQMETSCV